ncbi:MAG: RES domain-containing protein [Deltaproteobacteria bacterium]|nr:RES domain-containing protein [Deltaproteobacteria bacterium]
MKNEKPWKLPHPARVLECIEKWRNLDLRKKEDSEIDTELSSFLDSLETFHVDRVHQNYSKLWRLRKFDYLIKNVSECWEPPAVNSIMGRCHAKGSSVLYVSKNLKTPFEELSVQPDEQVYLIKYKQIKPLNLKRIVSEEFKITNTNGKPFYDDESMLSYQILREFVRSEFLKPIGNGTEYLYRISGSMCRVWFDDKDSDGWLYPSVQSPNDFNIAIKPESARKKLEIEEVRIVQMVNKEDVIKSGKIKDSALPFFNMMKMVVESIFKSSINDNQITWIPSSDLGGDF